MSSRILVCPSCHQLGQQTGLSDQVARQLVGCLADDPIGLTSGWELRAAWCPRCEMPWVAAWPARLTPAARRTLCFVAGETSPAAQEEDS